MNISRKTFLTLLAGGMFAPRILAKDIGEKKRTLKKRLVLKDNEQLIGPMKIILDSSCEEILVDGKNIIIRDINFIAKNNTQKQSTVIRLSENAENITIENCRFDGQRYSILQAEKPTADDSSLKYKKMAKGVKFLNNLCEGMFSRHLFLSSIETILIQGNSFYDSVRDSIRLRQKTQDVKIINNTFKNIGRDSDESSDGIDSFWSGQELLIQGNKFFNIAKHAIDIKGKASKQVKIIGNHIEDCQYSGIYMSLAEKKSLNFVENIVISSNSITNCNMKNKESIYAGIYANSGVRNVVINSNLISMKFGNGISLVNYFESRAQNTAFIITDNVISCDDSKSCGVFSQAMNSVVIKSNIITSKQPIKRVEAYKNIKEGRVVIDKNILKSI